MTPVVIAVLGLLVIAACNQLAPRIGVASPLILLTLGIAVGFLPWVQAIEVSPDVILELVLPPLLFAAAVSMPVMDFRRELRAVSALAVILVLVNAVVLGVLIHWLVPALSLGWSIALGAVLSPTDAVAVAIARGSGVTHRIITVLEGEGLFNDATALVLLASAVSAAVSSGAGALHPIDLGPQFLMALMVALAVGWIVGEVSVRVRARITDPAADTAVSFTVPFLAAVPAEHLGGSGLVAAVVAGLVVSYHGPRLLPAANRRSNGQTWHTVELILEGAIFLMMGLQAFGIVTRVTSSPVGSGLREAVMLALVSGAVMILLRGVFVAQMLVWLRQVRRRHIRRLDQEAERMARFEQRLAHACDVDEEVLQARHLSIEEWTRALARWRKRLERGERRHHRARADMDYFVSSSLGPREGVIIVWAGMRGAVTLAAAQTLPWTTPMRSFILLVALLVASGSLIIQGLTLGPLIRLVRPRMAADAADAQERERLLTLLRHSLKETAFAQVMSAEASRAHGDTEGQGAASSSTTAQLPAILPITTRPLPIGTPLPAGTDGTAQQPDGDSDTETLTHDKARVLAIEAIHVQRDALLDARDEGVFSSRTLEAALARLDAQEVLLSTHR